MPVPTDTWSPVRDDGSVDLNHINGSHVYLSTRERREAGRTLNCFHTAWCLASTLAGTPLVALPLRARGTAESDVLESVKQEFGGPGRKRWRAFKAPEELYAYVASWGPKCHGIVVSQDHHGHCYNIVTDSRGQAHVLDPQSGRYTSLSEVSMGMDRPTHRVFPCGSWQGSLKFEQWDRGDWFQQYLID